MTAEKSKEEQPGTDNKLASFEGLLLPHLNAAYNLARWITGNEQDVEDLVQETYLRALKCFHGFQGGDGRPWLLAIVRNTCYAWLRLNGSNKLTIPFDEEIHGPQGEACDPETLLLQRAESELIQKTLQELALEFREVLALRELEGLSYKRIAAVAGISIGTVMSRLARARMHLSKCVMRGVSMEAKR